MRVIRTCATAKGPIAKTDLKNRNLTGARRFILSTGDGFQSSPFATKLDCWSSVFSARNSALYSSRVWYGRVSVLFINVHQLQTSSRKGQKHTAIGCYALVLLRVQLCVCQLTVCEFVCAQELFLPKKWVFIKSERTPQVCDREFRRNSYLQAACDKWCV